MGSSLNPIRPLFSGFVIMIYIGLLSGVLENKWAIWD